MKYAFKSSFVYNAKHKNVLSVRRMPAWLNVLFFVFIFSFFFHFISHSILLRLSLVLPSVFCSYTRAYQRATWIDSLTSILKLTHPSFSLGFANFHSLKVSHSIYFLSSVLVPFFSAFFLFIAKHKHILCLSCTWRNEHFFLTCSIHLLTYTMRKSSFSSELEYCFQFTQKKKRLQRAIFDGFGIHSKWLSQ